MHQPAAVAPPERGSLELGVVLEVMVERKSQILIPGSPRDEERPRGMDLILLSTFDQQLISPEFLDLPIIPYTI